MMVQIGVNKYLNMNHVELMEVDRRRVQFFMNHHVIRNAGTSVATARLFEIESDDLPSQAEAERFADALARASWTGGSYQQFVDWEEASRTTPE